MSSVFKPLIAPAPAPPASPNTSKPGAPARPSTNVSVAAAFGKSFKAEAPTPSAPLASTESGIGFDFRLPAVHVLPSPAPRAFGDQRLALPEHEVERITAEAWKILDRLPQRDSIESSDARQWIGEMVQRCGDKALWHATRLGGFGGSEIGALVRNHHGLHADFNVSAHDIVLSKLMRRVPEESRAQMDRGNENEQYHAQRFWSEMGALRDQTAYGRLAQAKGRQPWMRYSPDDVVLMRSSGHAWTRGAAETRPVSRWLIDYKSPSEVAPAEEVAFQYACQLAQGAILCEESGIELHGLMLSQFDWKNWALKNDVMQVPAELRELVREAGDWAWSHVMSKTVPEYVRAPRVEGQGEFVERASPIAASFAQVQALQKAAADRARELREAVLSHLDPNVRFDGARLTVPGGTLSAARSVDAEQVRKLLTPEQLASVQKCDGHDAKLMAAHLRTMGIDLKPFAKMAVDANKLAALAQSLSLDYDSMVTEQIRFSPNADIVQAAQSFIDEHFPNHGARRRDEMTETIDAASVVPARVERAADARLEAEVGVGRQIEEAEAEAPKELHS